MEDEMALSPPAPTDPRLPLNAMQVFKLKKSWKGIKRCLDDTGVEMFIRLFRVKPCLQTLFVKLKGKTLEELRVDEEMEKQAGKVMGVLDECVQNIDNVDTIMELLARTAALHVPFHGFSSSMYMDMEQPILEAVKITLGDRYTDNMDGIYKTTVRYLLDILTRSHDDVS